ncbi:hypothetical protein TWF696_004553 [Orbilia brochopaga]|uniref:Uncharacterized protein n=1 Tax=Orbilia brochopaga TaxID=3140254 RepID=A0AAV9VCZ4_9PEZI
MPCSAHPEPFAYINPSYDPPLKVYIILFEVALHHDLERAGEAHILARPFFRRYYTRAYYGSPVRTAFPRRNCFYMPVTPLLMVVAAPWILWWSLRGAATRMKRWAVSGATAAWDWVQSWR